MARARGSWNDSAIRQEIAWNLEAYAAVSRWNTRRAKATGDRAEAATLMALGKIAMSRILHEDRRRPDRDHPGRSRCSPGRCTRSETP